MESQAVFFFVAQVCRNGNLTSVPIFFSSSKMPGAEVKNPEGGDDDMAGCQPTTSGPRTPARNSRPAGYVWRGVG